MADGLTGEGLADPAWAVAGTGVLVLTYNHEPYIRACLESILRSSLTDFHVWVLDDGSTDGTCAVVDQLARETGMITLLRQAHSGGVTSGSSQRLVEASQGAFMVLMSGDDMLGPADRLQGAIDAMRADPELDVVLPRMVYLMQDPAREAPPCHGEPLLSALRSGRAERVLGDHLYRSVSRIFLQGMVVRRAAVDAFGGFDTTLMADDYAFVVRLFEYLRDRGRRFRFDEDSLWLYRVHSENIHRNPVRQFTVIAEVVEKYIPADRRQLFQWDAVVCTDIAQFRAIQDNGRRILGAVDGARAIAPSFRATVRSAARRSDVMLLFRILLGRNLSGTQRLTAARQLLRGIGRRAGIGRRGQCRLGS